MKKFKGSRNLIEINHDMQLLGMEIYDGDFEKGGDWIKYSGVFYDMPLVIAFNTCNGWFATKNSVTGELLATHKSIELDDIEWYGELLNIFYEKEAGTAEVH